VVLESMDGLAIGFDVGPVWSYWKIICFKGQSDTKGCCKMAVSMKSLVSVTVLKAASHVNCVARGPKRFYRSCYCSIVGITLLRILSIILQYQKQERGSWNKRCFILEIFGLDALSFLQ